MTDSTKSGDVVVDTVYFAQTHVLEPGYRYFRSRAVAVRRRCPLR